MHKEGWVVLLIYWSLLFSFRRFNYFFTAFIIKFKVPNGKKKAFCGKSLSNFSWPVCPNLCFPFFILEACWTSCSFLGLFQATVTLFILSHPALLGVSQTGKVSWVIWHLSRKAVVTNGSQTFVCFRLSQQASLLNYTFLGLQGILDSVSVGGEYQEPEF